MAEPSSSMGVNKLQLLGTHDNKVIVPVCDWASFCGQYLSTVPKDAPGIVYFKENRSSAE